jgi:hypothetical protein
MHNVSLNRHVSGGARAEGDDALPDKEEEEDGADDCETAQQSDNTAHHAADDRTDIRVTAAGI